METEKNKNPKQTCLVQVTRQLNTILKFFLLCFLPCLSLVSLLHSLVCCCHKCQNRARTSLLTWAGEKQKWLFMYYLSHEMSPSSVSFAFDKSFENFLYIHPDLSQNTKDGGSMFLQIPCYRSRWQILSVSHWGPFCCVIAEDDSGMFRDYHDTIEVKEIVSGSVGFLEENTPGFQQGLNIWLCHSTSGRGQIHRV